MAVGKGFVTQTAFKKHLDGDWRTVHELWSHIRNYMVSYAAPDASTYSKTEIDAFFEGYSGGKAQVDAGNVVGLTQGSIPFADASGFLTEDNSKLFWDAGNEWLGIGRTPAYQLDVAGSAKIRTTLYVTGATALSYTLTVAGDSILSSKLRVSGTGNDIGGVSGNDEVITRFQETTAATNTAISINAITGQDPILYLAENNSAIWDIRNDASATDKFQIRYQVGGVNRTDFQIDNAGNVSILTGTFTAGQGIFSGLTISTGIIDYDTTNHNYLFGIECGTDISVGDALYNVFIGNRNGEQVTTGDYNVAIGYLNLYGNKTGSQNVAIGSLCLVGNTNLNHAQNVAIGYQAAYTMETGTGNVAIGIEAGKYFKTGSYNVALGGGAGRALQSGVGNMFIGAYAGYSSNAVSANVYVGVSSGHFGVSAANNTAIGGGSIYLNVSGANNVAIGVEVMRGVSTKSQSNNVFIGYQAGYLIDVSDNNVVIGYKAGYHITTGTGNVVIGYMAGETNLTTGNNQLWIANSNTATPLIYGEFDTPLLKVTGEFDVVGASKLGDGGVTNYAETKADGEINLHGTARVLKHLHFNNAAFTKGSTAPTQVILGNYNGWSFDIGDDSVITATLPDDWDPTTDLTIKVCWYIDEAYAADKEIQWRVDWSALPEDFTEAVDAPTHSGQIDSGDINIPAVAKTNGESTIGTIAAASLSALDCLGFTLSRIAVTNDDPTDDPIVLHLTIEYTSNKLGV